MATEVLVPTLGESITEATVGEWLKQPGDPVAVDEAIASLETDKVSVEVPSPVAGVMGQHAVKVGDTVEVGAMIATIESGDGAASAPAQAAPAATAGEQAPAEPKGDAPAALSPSVRRAVLEHGVDPATIKGTGRDGRLTKEDVAAAASSKPAVAPAPAAPAAAAPASSGGRNEERVKMTRLRQTIAKRLKEAQNTAAMLTTFNDVDMTAVIDAALNTKVDLSGLKAVRLVFFGHCL
jgi:2-oxoglutarate dehydrogenase E2 component (dihydrolipoamide succinyltransferase)